MEAGWCHLVFSTLNIYNAKMRNEIISPSSLYFVNMKIRKREIRYLLFNKQKLRCFKYR